ncbi:hypothetical protein BGZ46_006992 [Entomortierella lignicola]|nr:hypothetical protein BGZ46_006992 [Entomortierella lignicola]
MAPTTRSRATGKRSPSPHNAATERPRKQSRRETEKEIKQEDSDPKDSSAHNNASPKTSTEVKKEESKDDLVKTEEKESTTSKDQQDSNVKSESQKEEESNERIIEKGHAFFFYRPKLDVEIPSGADDTQKLYMLLSPDEDKDGKHDSSSKRIHRLLLIPRKSLPMAGKGPQSRIWTFVDEASEDLEKVKKKLEEYTYSTKTHGERTQEAARLIGEVRYNILLDQKHSHFLYELEVPQEPGEVQQEFGILKEGQFLMQVKNPEIQTPASERGQSRYATLGEGAAKLPKHLQEKFRGIRKDWVRYAALDSSEFLDIQHVEIGLFAVNKDAKEEYTEVMEALEAEVEDNEVDPKNPEAQVYKDLDLEESKIPTAVEEFK